MREIFVNEYQLWLVDSMMSKDRFAKIPTGHAESVEDQIELIIQLDDTIRNNGSMPCTKFCNAYLGIRKGIIGHYIRVNRIVESIGVRRNKFTVSGQINHVCSPDIMYNDIDTIMVSDEHFRNNDGTTSAILLCSMAHSNRHFDDFVNFYNDTKRTLSVINNELIIGDYSIIQHNSSHHLYSDLNSVIFVSHVNGARITGKYKICLA